jgi:hypothetical protein
MEDIGYPIDAISLIGNIYIDSTTSFLGTNFGTTQPINIQRGTIQGDTLSPYLFLIFLEPLLRWLQRDQLGYTFRTSENKVSAAAYADDLATITNTIDNMKKQVTKLERYNTWAEVELGIPKCALTGCPNASHIPHATFKAYLQSQKVTYKGNHFPVLSQNEPYLYLGIQITPTLKWKQKKDIVMKKFQKQSAQLMNSPAAPKQKIKNAQYSTKTRSAIQFSCSSIFHTRHKKTR